MRSLRLIFPLVLGMVAAAALAAPRELTLEAIFSEHGLTGPAPEDLRWRSDGKQLTYILEDAETGARNLWAYDVESGDKRILVSGEQLSRMAPSLEAATNDERERERRRRYAVASYLWSPDSTFLLFTSAGSLYLYDVAAENARLLTPNQVGVQYPKFSPDGRWVSYVFEHDLWIVPESGGDPRRLTTGGSKDLLHGDLDWIYPEELAVRYAYAWSPDSSRIAFLEMDESRVPTYPIPTLTAIQPSVDLQRYPKAGDPNPRVRVGVVDAKSGRGPEDVVWLSVAAEYIPRFDWMDAGRIVVQTLNRAQTQLKLELADATGRARTLHVERSPDWINVTDDLRFLGPDKGFLWTSERSGLRHIELFDYDGKLKKTLTSGEWEVNRIEGVNREAGIVYYSADRDNPIGEDLYAVKLDGSDLGKQATGHGSHTITMNDQATAYADRHSSLTRPGGFAVRRLADSDGASIYEAPNLDEYEPIEPRLSTIETADGAVIRILLLTPPKIEPGKKLPLLVYVYGGPHAPTISDQWGSRGRYLFHQYLARKGYVVAQIDDRASSLLGHKYEAALLRAYGPTALKDQLTAIDSLVDSNAFIDPRRIGVWGWSGGGMATCVALTHSDRFKVGVAAAPVTDWHLYDSIYTERYMGLPDDEKDAYATASCVKAAGNLSGRLMLIHGTADDNVHFQNTEQMIDALIKAGKSYDLRIYPGQTHGISDPRYRLHVFKQIERFLDENL